MTHNMTLDALYQEKILALARKARAHQQASSSPEKLMYSAIVKNPACGDEVEVGLNLDEDDCVSRISTAVQGCALCEAATGLLLEEGLGRHKDEFQKLKDDFAAWLRDEKNGLTLHGHDAFVSVKAFGSRHRCVCLPFEAAANAIANAVGKDSI